jgi:hypothetical protein
MRMVAFIIHPPATALRPESAIIFTTFKERRGKVNYFSQKHPNKTGKIFIKKSEK